MHEQATRFSHQTRRDNLTRMREGVFDILVIGGGITGAGIASAAARQGYRVALVEKGDFASGTSSKSSKLVHGGLRYLATGEVGLVFHACRQRRTLLRLAPHLVWPLPFVLPIYEEQRDAVWRVRAAMWLYDALALFRNVRRHEIWTAAHALAHEPLLNPRRLLRAARYYDCGADDARLTLATILEAHRAGAVIANYADMTGLLQAGGRVAGAQVRDRRSGAELEIRARVVVSAAGPWTDAVLGLTGTRRQRWLRPSKGVHLIVPRRRACSQAALTFTSPRDGRFMFLVPWGDHAIIGTTDSDYSEDLDSVHATAADVAEILEATNRAFPTLGLSETDIVSTYAGVRPLISEDGTSSTQNSREHRAGEIVPGLVAVAGGKLTTYRTIAREVISTIARILARDHAVYPPDRARHSWQPLPGATLEDEAGFYAHQPGALIAHLAHTYGTETGQVLALLERPALRTPIAPDLPAIGAQVVYAIRNEMALTLEDVLERRTHVLHLAEDQGLGSVARVADLMSTELGWSPAQRAAEIARYHRAVALTRRWRE